jgi:hypothetical protein
MSNFRITNIKYKIFTYKERRGSKMYTYTTQEVIEEQKLIDQRTPEKRYLAIQPAASSGSRSYNSDRDGDEPSFFATASS